VPIKLNFDDGNIKKLQRFKKCVQGTQKFGLRQEGEQEGRREFNSIFLIICQTFKKTNIKKLKV